MSDDAFKIPLNHRVRLKDDRADVYPRAFGGSEGWIKRQQVDPVGNYAMVYVVWDKEHWTYNGENDTWTFEEHFEPVMEKSQVQRNREQELRKQEAKKEAEARRDAERDIEEDDVPPPHLPTVPGGAQEFVERITDEMKRKDAGEQSADDRFIEVISAAMDAASESEAFFCVAVQRHRPPGADGPEFILVPLLFGDSRTPEAELLLESQLSDIASSAHQAMVVKEVQRLMQSRIDKDQ